MAYISYAEGRPLDPALAQVYARCGDADGRGVPNVFRAQSHRPALLETHLDLYQALMHGPLELSRVRREMIAVVVSQINACHY